MKTTLVIATLAFAFTAAPVATMINSPLAQSVASYAVVEAGGQTTANAWDGRWQGTAVSGMSVVLDLLVKGQRLTGRLTVGKQSADITDGKVAGAAFTLKTGPIDGRSVAGKGRSVGDALEFTIDGVKDPLTLTRVK